MKFKYLFFLTIIIIYVIIVNNYSARFDVTFMILNLGIVVLSSYNLLLKKNYPFSLYRIFYFFSLFFFGIGPLIEFGDKVSFFGMPVISSEAYIFAYLTLIPFIFIFDIVYQFVLKRKDLWINNTLIKKFSCPDNYRFSRKSIIILSIVISLSIYLVLSINNFSMYNLLVRGGEEITRAEVDKSYALVVGLFVRPIPIIVFLIYCVLGKNKLVKFLLLAIALIIIAPSGIPRFLAAALYIPVLLMNFNFLRRGNYLVYSLIAGLLLVFPFLNQLRTYSADKDFTFGLDFEMFKAGHFDSFSTYVRIIDAEFITYGDQLMGSVLFFIPRSIWISKPLTSGNLYAERFGAFYDNLAVNYFGEGYLNFGFAGVLIFTLLIAYYCAIFDKAYWKYCFGLKNNLFPVLYFISLGMLVFFLRGDLMNAIAYTVGLFSSVYFIVLLLRQKK